MRRWEIIGDWLPKLPEREGFWSGKYEALSANPSTAKNQPNETNKNLSKYLHNPN
jgi:hypothetical protein